MLESMPKWILASVAKHFNDHKGSLVMYLEGEKRNTNKSQDYMELRMNGPDRRHIAKYYYGFDITINVLVQSLYNDVDAYRYIKTCGLVAQMFESSIRVYKFGDAIGDDRTVLVGCLSMQGLVETNHFGRQAPALDMNTSEVQGRYSMELTINEE
jgi:hypothetical protein